MDVEKIIREYITKSWHLSLATSRENKPWISEVHFTYDDNLNLYYRSTTARRHSQEIELNPYVAGNIVKQHTLDEYPHGIYFESTAKLIEEETKMEEIYAYFKSRMDLDKNIIEDAKKSDGDKFYKITVENWYAFGKFGGDSGQKYKLVWNGGNK